MAHLCDGYIAGNAPTEQVHDAFRAAETAWKEAGRTGRPRLLGVMQFALGPDAERRGVANLSDYYAFAGFYHEYVVDHFAMTPEEIRDRISVYADIGMDELLLAPYLPEVEQLDRLADLVS